MAVYKVPQDVEADDKLIGPFNFRQFIYLIIVAGSIALAWVLGNLLLPLAILPLPIILFFGALALPLRKDQPMETYLAAIVSFYLKPRKRMWDPDGQQALVEITAPKVVEVHRTKDLSQSEAERRLSYLANIVDTRGWAVRGVGAEPNSSMNPDVYYEAQQAEDVLDTSTATAHQIENQLDQTDQRRHQELMERMQHPAQPAPGQPASVPVTPVSNPYAGLSAPSDTAAAPAADEPAPHLTVNPYPSMQQAVIQPLADAPASDAKTSASGEGAAAEVHSQNASGGANPSSNITTSEKPLSPDIINLANNPDLSIETIAHEANRIKEKQGLPDDEVVISLH